MDSGRSTQQSTISVDQIVEHLDLILQSPFFTSSKRSQDFLRYVVLETTQGRGNAINERNIAHDVFGKGLNFEPGEDSLVRVKAREVRKRLSDFYQSAPESALRIELPLGGYAPSVYRNSASIVPILPQAQMTEFGAKPINRRRFAWLAGGLLGSLGAAAFTYSVLREHAAPLDRLWKPVFATKVPLLIFIPILKDKEGNLTDRVGIGPAAALAAAGDFLSKHDYPYHLRFGADLTPSQLQEQPVLLLGGRNTSEWTLRMTQNLRYTFAEDESTGSYIIDTQTKKTWKTIGSKANGYVDQDYGILCRLFDSAKGQIVLIAAGATTFGTEGAAKMLFDPLAFSRILEHAPSGWETKNFQAVIHVSVLGTTPSFPDIVATYFW